MEEYVETTKGYKTQLRPNRAQEKLLVRSCGAARWAYNWGLGRKQESYKLIGKSPTAIDLHRELNRLKKTLEYGWLYEVSKCVPQEALRDLDQAFANFFRRLALKKAGKLKGKVGYPRPKSRKRGLGSFRLTGAIHVEEGRVKLPRIGWVRLWEKGYLPPTNTENPAHVLSATVSERAGRWFVSVQVREEVSAPIPATGEPVGVDLGIKTMAVCSDGALFPKHKALETNLRKLRRLNKKLARQQKGSNRREQTRKELARLHYRVACIRSDAIHKADLYPGGENQPSGE